MSDEQVPARPKKPVPKKKVAAAAIDWNYWHTVMLVGLYVILLWPSVKPILLFVLDGKRPVVPGPVVPGPVDPSKPDVPLPDPPEYQDKFADVTAKVPEWLGLVASPDIGVAKPKYAAALRSTAEALDKDSSVAVMPALRDAVAREIGEDGYLDWSLFTIRIVETFRALKAEGRIDGSAASHAAVLRAVESGLLP